MKTVLVTGHALAFLATLAGLTFVILERLGKCRGMVMWFETIKLSLHKWAIQLFLTGMVISSMLNFIPHWGSWIARVTFWIGFLWVLYSTWVLLDPLITRHTKRLNTALERTSTLIVGEGKLRRIGRNVVWLTSITIILIAGIYQL